MPKYPKGVAAEETSLVAEAEAEALFTVMGMTCSACAGLVEKAVKRLPGIREAVVHVLNNWAQVMFFPNFVSAENICETIEDVGFQATLINDEGNEKSILLEVQIKTLFQYQTSKQIVASKGSENKEEGKEISLPTLLRLNLEGLLRFVGISNTICKINFPGLITLKLENLPQIMNLSPDVLASETGISHATNNIYLTPSWVQDLQNLEQLEVRDCRSLETVFDIKDLETKQNPKQFPAMFSDLEIMELSKLPLLKCLWNPSQNITAFQTLRMLQVMQCGILRYLFPLFIAENLVKLESMYISDCAAMRDILAENERGHGDEEATKRIVFPQVNSLHLDNLPSLRTFCRAPCAIHLPLLTTLVMGCLTMETFVSSSEATG